MNKHDVQNAENKVEIYAKSEFADIALPKVNLPMLNDKRT